MTPWGLTSVRSLQVVLVRVTNQPSGTMSVKSRLFATIPGKAEDPGASGSIPTWLTAELAGVIAFLSESTI